MSDHVKDLACTLLLKVMCTLLIRYLKKPTVWKSLSDEQELMKTNIKVLKVWHRTVGWMTRN